MLRCHPYVLSCGIPCSTSGRHRRCCRRRSSSNSQRIWAHMAKPKSVSFRLKPCNKAFSLEVPVGHTTAVAVADGLRPSDGRGPWPGSPGSGPPFSTQSKTSPPSASSITIGSPSADSSISYTWMMFLWSGVRTIWSSRGAGIWINSKETKEMESQVQKSLTPPSVSLSSNCLCPPCLGCGPWFPLTAFSVKPPGHCRAFTSVFVVNILFKETSPSPWGLLLEQPVRPWMAKSCGNF